MTAGSGAGGGPAWLDLVPLLGLPAGADVAVQGTVPQGWEADLVAAGHRLVTSSAGPTGADADALVLIDLPLQPAALARLRPGGVLVALCRRGQAREVQRAAAAAGLRTSTVHGMDAVDRPTVLVPLAQPGPARYYVGRMRQPWTAGALARRARDLAVAGSPARARLFPAALVLSRRG